VRARTAFLVLALLAAGCGGGKKATTTTTSAQPALQVGIAASTHRPKVNAKWPYEVKAPGRGTLTVQIVDPIGGVHPVQYDNERRNVTGFPFHGTFRDYLEFPPDSRGYRLTVRATVKTDKGQGIASYWVRSQ
jgi:hypothetical protein